MELINALKNPDLYPHAVKNIEVLETHLSWVILTGLYAYKIKKPFNLGFQDFTTLEKRKQFCELEIAYNQKLAPAIYVEVVAIYGSPSTPSFTQEGQVLEYAVKMVEFPQENLLSALALQKKLSFDMIDNIAEQLARFHQQAAVCKAELPYGSPTHIMQPVLENFQALQNLEAAKPYLSKLEKIASWAKAQFTELSPLMATRKTEGYVRACHGDLHLRNIVLQNHVPVIFDCIEFNESFRFIDVLNDVAFLAMDLDHLYSSSLGHHFVNRYFELTQDYAGIKLLRFYQCYRAMVRAKASALLLAQETTSLSDVTNLQVELETFIELAFRYTQPVKPTLTIMMGPAGSGKTLYSGQLLEKTGAIRLRSDILRKKLHGMAPLAKSSEQQKEELYSAKSTQQLYRHLQTLAKQLIQDGYSVIIDATCLMLWQRELFHDIAKQQHASFTIILLICPVDVLEQRIAHRARLTDASEADVNVLNQQLDEAEPLTDEEEAFTTIIAEDIIDNLILAKEKQYA